VLVDHDLSGVIVGLTLATRAAEVYRALLEATAFGTRMIIEAFEASGVSGHRARDRRRPDQDPLPDADLRRRAARPLSVIGSAQAPALGSAIHAAVAAGAYPDVPAPRGDGQPGPARTCRTRTAPPSTTSCTPSTSPCTTTSAAAPTTCCTGCARSRLASLK
jgi:ribulose kinase